MKSKCLILGLSTVFSAAALAADLTPAPPVLASSSWEGFYFGGHVGSAFGRRCATGETILLPRSRVIVADKAFCLLRFGGQSG